MSVADERDGAITLCVHASGAPGACVVDEIMSAGGSTVGCFRARRSLFSIKNLPCTPVAPQLPCV